MEPVVAGQVLLARSVLPGGYAFRHGYGSPGPHVLHRREDHCVELSLRPPPTSVFTR